MQLSKPITLPAVLAFGCLILLMLRLYFVLILPFVEGTEARYAEVARLMVDTQNWLLPLADYDQPYAGQAPLSIWLSAIFMRAFGEVEWVVRLPHYLTAVVVVLLCQNFIRLRSEGRTLWLSLMIALNPLFWLLCGLATPAMLVVLATTLSVLSLWQVLDGPKDKTPYAVIHLGIGLAMGVLVTGAVFMLLIALVLCIYLLFSAVDRARLNTTALFSAVLLSLVIAMPWYLAVEHYHPGFVAAFIFTQPDIIPADAGWFAGFGLWQDPHLSRIARIAALGSALFLVMLAASLLPQLYLSYRLSRYQSFLLSWLLAAFLFVLLAPGPSYGWALLVSLPLCLLLADMGTTYWRHLCLYAVVTLVLTCAGLVQHQGLLQHSSDPQQLLQQTNEDLLVFYQSDLSYSSRFYTQGRGKAIQTLDEIKRWMLPQQPFYLVSPVILSTSPQMECQRVNQQEQLQLSLCHLRP